MNSYVNQTVHKTPEIKNIEKKIDFFKIKILLESINFKSEKKSIKNLAKNKEKKIRFSSAKFIPSIRYALTRKSFFLI